MKKLITSVLLFSGILLFGQNQTEVSTENVATCPVTGKTLSLDGGQSMADSHAPNATSQEAKTNREWWPNQLNLSVLRQNSNLSDPMGAEFDYEEAFSELDYAAL